ncbi:unnamed protein product [Diamesa serratosioi]
MSPPRNKKRSSILKKRLSSIETPEKTKRKINFSEKNQIKEFIVCPDTATIWGNSYEESLGKSSNSDGSNSTNDASDRKFNSMSMSNFTASSILHESEKENILTTIDNCSIVDMSLDTNLAEKKRAKAYEPANSTLINMSLEEPDQVPAHSKLTEEVKMILSPRKITYFHESSNLSISVREKVMVKASESIAQQNILINCPGDRDDVTLSLTEGEKNLISRKSICQQTNMDLTLENFENKPSDNFRYNLRGKNNLKPKLKKNEVQSQKKVQPQVEKNHTINDVSDMALDTNPMKEPSTPVKKVLSADELMDFMMLDSPTRNVIGINAVTKKDEDNFKNSKVIFSASKYTKSIPRVKLTKVPTYSDENFLQDMALSTENTENTDKTTGTFNTRHTINKVLDMDVNTETLVQRVEKTRGQSNPRLTVNQVQDMDVNTETLVQRVEKTRGQSNPRLTVNQVQDMDLNTETLVEAAKRTSGPSNHRQTINQLEDMDLNTETLVQTVKGTSGLSNHRKTINQVQDMSVNLSVNSEKSTKNHERRTIGDTESMNMTNIDRESTSTTSQQMHKNSRKSVYTPLDIDETISLPVQDDLEITENKVTEKEMSFEHDIPRCEATASQRRETSYAQNFSFTSNFFDLPAKQQPRTTIYDTNDLDETCSLESTEYLLLKTNKLFANPMMTPSNDNSLAKSIVVDGENLEAQGIIEVVPVNRKTLLSDVSMSLTHNSVHVPKDDDFKLPSQRFTMNKTTDSMNLTNTEVSVTCLKSKLRPTIYVSEDLETCSPASNQNFSKRSRKTVYEDGMNISANHVEMPATNKASRMTIHQEETMDITVALVDQNAKSLIPQLVRKTIYQEEGMNITNTSSHISSPKPKYVPLSRNSRYTIYNEEAMNISENIIAPQLLKKDTEKLARETINQEMSIRQLEESTSSANDNDLKSLRSRQSIYIPHEMSGIELGDRPSVIMHGSIIDPVLEDNAFNISGVRSLGAIPKSFENRKTTHVIKDMDTNNATQETSMNNRSQMKTSEFEVYQDSVKKATKLLNITDAEIPLYDCDSPVQKEDTNDMLDNESFPMIEESIYELQADHEDSNDMQLSIVTPNYLSENFKDFINITVASPIGSSARSSSANMSIMSIQGTASTSIDDKFQKMDEFLEQLEKGVEKPRLKIDEFLAKLNIPTREPSTQLPIFNEDYFERKFREVQEQFAEATRLEKEQTLPQFPEIPTFTFLWRNHMECEDERIQSLVKEGLNECCVTPIFPESKDFIFLLANKFETDTHYDYWELETTYAPWRLLKITHKRMKAFVINIMIHEDVNVIESTIPIYFEKCFMVKDQWHKGTLSTKCQFIIREFEKKLGTDNFISLCKTSKELFNFMDYYENLVKQTRSLVNNFYNIFVNCDAIIEMDQERNSICLFKRHFVNDQSDIIDLKIDLYKHIEDITIEDLHIISLTKYFYEGRTKLSGGIQHLSGLMLIEILLYDTEKFLHEHTARITQPDYFE